MGTLRTGRHDDLVSPTPPTDAPAVLGELDPVEQAEWDRMIVRLELSSCLTRVDDATIYQYCKLFAETERIADEQAENRAAVRILEANIRDVEKADLVELFTNIVKLHTLITRATDQLRNGRMAIRQYLVEFGLTPAARGRIKLPAKPAESDAFTAFQMARTG